MVSPTNNGHFAAGVDAPVDNHRPRLLPHHLADLQRSGLTEEIAAAEGIYSETDHRKIADILNRKTWDRKQVRLVFPFYDESGAVVFQRVKPDNPPKRDGKVTGKYLSPTDTQLRVYIPRRTERRPTGSY